MNNISPEPPKSWTTTVRCRSNGLDFRVQADNFFPNWGSGSEKISVFLHLKRIFLLDVETEFRDPRGYRKKGRVRRFCGFVGRLFGGWSKGRRGKKKRSKKGNWLMSGGCCNGDLRNEQCWYGNQVSMVPLMGTLSLLSHSSAQRDHKGIVIHAFSYLFYLFVLFGSVKRSNISLIFIPVIVSLLGFYSSYWNYVGIASNYSNLGWNWIFASVVFSQLFSFSQSIFLQKKKLGLLLIASVPFLLYNFKREFLYLFMKIVLYGSRAWVSSLFLTAQALFNIVFKAKGMNYGFGVLLSSAYFWGKEIINYFLPMFHAHIREIIF